MRYPLGCPFLGTALGTVISLPTSGLIAAHPGLGWEWIFYLHGGLSLVWCIAWMAFVTDSPTNNQFVSAEEKNLICRDQVQVVTEAKSERSPIPWKCIAVSRPFWVLLLAHFLNNFAWYMVLVELPSFLSLGLGFPISEVNNIYALLSLYLNRHRIRRNDKICLMVPEFLALGGSILNKLAIQYMLFGEPG